MIANITMFHWDKKARVMTASLAELNSKERRFPSSILIGGQTANALFIQDHAAALRHEFWDGEMCEYVTNDPAAAGIRVVVTLSPPHRLSHE